MAADAITIARPYAEAVFAHAEEVVSHYFAQRRDDPARGAIAGGH